VNRSLLRSVIVTSILVCVFRPAAAGELKGRLLLGDRPAAGVTVTALPYEAPLDEARREARRNPVPAPLASATTAPDGSFVLTVPAEAGKEKLFTVRAEGGGVVAVFIGGVFASSESGDLGEHALSHGEKLAGKVTGASGAPVADAEVVLVPRLDPFADPELESAPRRTKTAADGTFRFDDASLAGNTVAAENSGFLGARRTGLRAGALQAPIVLGPGASVTGVVRKSDGRSAAVGALVRVEGSVMTRWVEAGADGAFAIPNAPVGTVGIVADAGETGYVEQRGVKLPPAQAAALTLTLRPPSALVGRTVDAKTGQPVPRTKIEIRAAGNVRTARSTPDGTYALRALPPETWHLRADEPHYVAWIHASVPVRPGETKKLDIPLVLGATLVGRVADENAQAVAGARCVLLQGGTTLRMRIQRFMRRAEPVEFRTKPDGTFKATRLVPGENQLLTVSHPEFESATIGGVTLVGGATKAGVAVVLQRGAVVTGVVKDGNGQPVPSAEAVLFDLMPMGGRGFGQAVVNFAGAPGSNRRSDTTGADGRFTLRGVAPGEYALTVTRSGYATERVEPLKVAKGATPTPVEVTLAPGSFIAGRVVRRSGGGVEGFMVSASVSGGARLIGRTTSDQPTGPDGSFFIEGLKKGANYDLQLFGPTGFADGKRGVPTPTSDLEVTVAGTGRITGRAVDAQAGAPLTDFQISYEADRGGGWQMGILIARAGRGQPGGVGQPVDVHSDDGAFALEDVPAGTWSVVVTAKGYQLARTSGVVVEQGSVAENVEVRVARGVLVKGHVADAQSGAAVANASVSFGAAGSPAGRIQSVIEATDGGLTTDADGRFEAEGLAPGSHTVHVTHPDYSDATQSFEVQAEGASVEIRMTQGGVLAGMVASDNGAPVPGASVTLAEAGMGGGGFGPMGSSQPTVTDGNGRFGFDHLSAGRYTLSASSGLHTSSPVEVVLQASQSQENISLRLQVGFTIQGTVSGLAPELMSGATVAAMGTDQYSQSTRVGADGRYELDNVPAGVVTVRGIANDSAGSTRSVTKQVTVSGDQPVVTADLVFNQGYTLSGHVTQGDQPVAGAMVFATLQGGGGRQASSRTDDAGGYSLAGLQEGTYNVNAISNLAGSGASRRLTVELTSDQNLDLAFPSAKLGGQVVDADRKTPVPDATVTAAALDTTAAAAGFQRPATTDSNGRFSFTNVDPGSYTLTTSKPDYRVDKRSVTAADQGTDALVVELTREAGMGIKVQDGLFGLPLHSVTMRVFDPQSAPVYGPASIALDDNGEGEIPSLPPGTYTVVAGASGYAPARLDGIIVPSPSVTIAPTPGGTIVIQCGSKTLTTGTVSGTITTAAGQPALLSLFNLQGRVAISEPNVTYQHIPPGTYVLTIPSAAVSKSFTVNEGATTIVQLP
jgi:protocatechuate 3,4-dioxygenase beta subunit